MSRPLKEEAVAYHANPMWNDSPRSGQGFEVKRSTRFVAVGRDDGNVSDDLLEWPDGRVVHVYDWMGMLP